MKKLLEVAAATIGAVSLCLLVGSAASAAEKEIVIGVSHQSLGFPYAVALQNGELKAAKELGVKTIDLDSNHDLLTQANQVDKLIAQKVDGILIDPADSQAAADWADKAKAAGIPIVSMGVFVGDPKQHQPPWVYPSLLAYADRSDPDQGYALGQVIAKDNPDGGKVAIVEGLPGFAAVLWRTEGVMKALNETGKKFDVVFKQPGNWDPGLAHQLCQDALQANPDLKILFIQDQAMAQGCLPALKEAKSSARIYTFDFSKSVKDVMADGAPIVTTCSEPATSGYQSVKALVDYIRDKKKPADPFLTYKWHIISKDNLEDCPVQF
jgi:ribose transport system substrate-binding protein